MDFSCQSTCSAPSARAQTGAWHLKLSVPELAVQDMWSSRGKAHHNSSKVQANHNQAKRVILLKPWWSALKIVILKVICYIRLTEAPEVLDARPKQYLLMPNNWCCWVDRFCEKCNLRVIQRSVPGAKDPTQIALRKEVYFGFWTQRFQLMIAGFLDTTVYVYCNFC